jgi:hypothetical protein
MNWQLAVVLLVNLVTGVAQTLRFFYGRGHKMSTLVVSLVSIWLVWRRGFRKAAEKKITGELKWPMQNSQTNTLFHTNTRAVNLWSFLRLRFYSYRLFAKGADLFILSNSFNLIKRGTWY